VKSSRAVLEPLGLAKIGAVDLRVMFHLARLPEPGVELLAVPVMPVVAV
jgi:hypothetical protein